MFRWGSAEKYADDESFSVKRLAYLRLPTLLIGMFIGLVLAMLTSRFTLVLSKDVAVVYFIPVIVYLADAVGTQTQAIYIRALREKKGHFHIYLLKESLLGLVFGLIFGVSAFFLTLLWQSNAELSLAVSLTIFLTTNLAPLVSLIITEIFWRRHADPAATVGPIATIVQDTLSIAIYGLVTSALLL